ncbi:hypothetical protein Gbth_233_001 [Gluconobacter thailandicus F149-1 = NBRC 100600]|nr:hypothetical protein Gbth_233_001 [Gluconobacter thailandicus F149-1 = NBRC 100600]GEL88679.1 hypothetical protein GTH01_30370 [Gluconobacter thailandicus F149-1 = NBRC 100600]
MGRKKFIKTDGQFRFVLNLRLPQAENKFCPRNQKHTQNHTPIEFHSISMV